MKLVSTLALSLGLAAAQDSETDWFGVEKQVRKSGIDKKLLAKKCLSNKCDISYKKFAQIAARSGFKKSILAKCDKNKKCVPKKSTEAVFHKYKKCIGMAAKISGSEKFRKMDKKKQKKKAAKNRKSCNRGFIGFMKCRQNDPKDKCKAKIDIFDDYIAQFCNDIQDYDYAFDYADYCGWESTDGSGDGDPVIEIPDEFNLKKEIKCGVRADKETSNLYDPNDPGRWGDIESRVLGGESADDGEFPWQISIKKIENGILKHDCGGSIIDRYTILTAAHCLVGYGPSDSFYVLGGLLKNYKKSAEKMKKLYKDDIENFGTFIQEINPSQGKGQIIIHENYDYVKYDIALIKLAEELVYPEFADADKEDINRKKYVGSLIRPICLPDSENLVEPVPGGRTNTSKKVSKKLNFWENKSQKKSVLKTIKKDLKNQRKKELARIKKQLKIAKKNGNKKRFKKLQKVLGATQEADDSEFCDIENTLRKNPYWITGWGKYNVKDSIDQIITTPLNMQKAAIIPVTNDYCREKGWGIDESQVCADNLPGCAQIDVCAGDSGGPISWKVDRAIAFMQEGKNIKDDRYKIVGLVSYGESCSKENENTANIDKDREPGVYTRVSSYVDWIKKYALNTQTIYTNNEK